MSASLHGGLDLSLTSMFSFRVTVVGCWLSLFFANGQGGVAEEKKIKVILKDKKNNF